MPKFIFGAENGCEPNFVLDLVPKLTFGAGVTLVPFGAEVTRAEHRSARLINIKSNQKFIK